MPGTFPLISYCCRAYLANLAIASLSLENYNDRLFERFLCLLPEDPDQHWHNIKDAYGAQLWDIEPSVQVAGIGEYEKSHEDLMDDEIYQTEYFLRGVHQSRVASLEASREDRDHESIREDNDKDEPEAPPASHAELTKNDVVILDGCFAATVHWDGFQRVYQKMPISCSRFVIRMILPFNFIPLIIGIILISVNIENLFVYKEYIRRAQPIGMYTLIAGFIILGYGLIIALWAPALLLILYDGRVWDTQPWLFGFEGYLPVDEMERKVFGVCRGRLTWGANASSPLSHHELHANRWVAPRDPCSNPKTKGKVDAAAQKAGEVKIFTIVDTYSMTATLFEARRPPVALLICGSEGGMQRALGCSFDWTTSTFYRETVLRLETRVLSRMDRVRRVRLGIRRVGEEERIRSGQEDGNGASDSGFRHKVASQW